MNQKEILKKRKQLIQQSICILENNYPDDNIIEDYKDFLKYRDYIGFYKFNPKVYISIIDLTYRLWNTGNRISRSSLIQTLKRYYLLCNNHKQLPEKTSNQLFYIFKQVHFYKNINLKEESLSKLAGAMNYIIRDIELNEPDQKWLCENADYSIYTINRLLRYKFKSPIISAWARRHYNHNQYRQRRAEVASWIIDENISFEIGKAEIIKDFEYIFDNSKELLQNIYDYPKLLKNTFCISDQVRFESVTLNRNYNDNRQTIKSNINNIQRKSNMWTIAYSRLSKETQSKLLKDKYIIELESSLVYICKRNGLLGLLKWLKKNIGIFV